MMSILGDRILAQRKVSYVKLTKIDAPDFDLAMTLDSGQVFHWEKAGPGFVGVIGDEPLYVEQRGASLMVSANCEQLVQHYFALDHPLSEICASFPDDPAMKAARKFCRGLRIIRQPKWECLATFICSSMKQVAHIRQISRKLRERFGEAREIVGRSVYTFPSAERIAASSDALPPAIAGSNVMRARISGEESVSHGPSGRVRRSRPRIVGRIEGCRSSVAVMRAPGRGREGC